MIRIKCPKCQRQLPIDESQIGGIGICPDCGQRFRIPAIAADLQNNPAGEQAFRKKQRSHAKELRAKFAKPRSTREEEDTSPAYAFQRDPEPPSQNREPVERPRPVEYGGEEPNEDVLDAVYGERKKKKGRREKTAFFGGGNYFAAMIGGLVLLCIVLGVVTYFLPKVFLLSLFTGFAVTFIAVILFLANAFQDDGVGAGLCCLFIPLYAGYYLLTHWDREQKPFYLSLMGVLLVLTGIGFATVRMPPSSPSDALPRAPSRDVGRPERPYAPSADPELPGWRAPERENRSEPDQP